MQLCSRCPRIVVGMWDPIHVAAIVRDNPRRNPEYTIDYIGRVCVLSGLLEPGEVGDAPVGGWSSAGESLQQEVDPWWTK